MSVLGRFLALVSLAVTLPALSGCIGAQLRFRTVVEKTESGSDG